MVRHRTGGHHPGRMHARPLVAWLLVLAPILAACGGTATTDPVPTDPAPTDPAPTEMPAAASSTLGPSGGPPDLVPAAGTAWFGMNLDWANDSVSAVTERLGVAPSVWVQFVAFPLDEGGRAILDAFVEQIATVDGIGLITLEPHGGLETVTPAAASELADLLAGYWADHGVPTIVRFAHEMNGSWYPWGQQPEAYVAAFRTVAEAVHARAPASAMAWAPNEGAGYPFPAGPYLSDDPLLDTDGDGEITNGDDPYSPYWPGDDAVDWVGMSVYHWGLEWPWGENEMPPPGGFRSLLTGGDAGVDFYATWAEGHDKPMGIFETAALYNPNAPGPSEADLKAAWWRQVTDPAIAADFPRLAMLNWFEWRKEEPEVGGVIDWRLSADPDLARRLLDEVPEGWLQLGGLGGIGG